MAGRQVTVSLSANVAGFVAGMQRAGAAVDGVTSKMAKSARDNSQEWNTVGSALTKVGAVAAAGLGLAAKAAMDWESAFAGVRKTVDGSPQQIAALEGELRGMARTMATSHRDIAAVAEAAGQLGVATDDVADFSRTMIMLGETTNMTADQAATSMAQFMTIMGTAPDQVGNLGAALVGLGNNSATTESQILQMSQRIAGAGKAIGLSEADVLGFSAAIASTGIEVEAGGTAISMAMLKMEQAVRAGGRELDVLASTAGMSAADFKQAFETDAAGAINAFVEGLGRVGASGGDVTAILSELGITGIREADTLRRLANAGTLLGDSLRLSRDELAAGTALLEEYGERANTTEFKVSVAWNNIKDAAISAGQAMLPAISAAAQAIAEFAQWVGGLDPAVHKFAAGSLAVVAAVGLIGGAAMKAVVGLLELRAALTAIGALTAVQAGLSAFAGGLAAVTRAAAPLLIALAAVAVTARAMNQAFKENDAGYQMTRNLETMTQAILKVSDASKQAPDFDQIFTFETGLVIKERLTGLDDAMREINKTGAMASFENWSHGMGLATSLAGEARERFLELDTAMAALTTGGQMREAAAAFDEIAEAGRRAGMSSEQLIALFPAYSDAVRNAGEAMKGTNLTADEMVALMSGRIPPSLREAAAANSDLANELAEVTGAAEQATMSIQDYANAMLALSGSQIGVEQAIANANAALAENGRNIDLTTEAGRKNVGALNQLASASMQYVQTLADQGASQAEQTEAITRARGEFERLAEAMGYTEPEIRKMADAFFATQAPSEQAAAAARNFAVEAAAGSQAANDMAAALRDIPPTTEVTVTADGIEPVTIAAGNLSEELQRIPADKVITVTMPNGEVVTGTAAEIQAGLERIQTEKNITFTTPGAVEAQAATEALQSMLTGLPEYRSIQVSIENGRQTYTTAQRLAEVIRDIPDDKNITLKLKNGEQVTMTAGQARAAIEGIPELKNTTITADPSGAVAGANTASSSINGVQGVTREIDVDPSGAIVGSGQAQGAIDATRGVTRDVDVDPSGAVSGSARAQGSIDATHGVTRDINVTSNAASAASTAQARMNAVRNVSRTITITTIQRTEGVKSSHRFGGITVADGGMVPAVSGLAGTGAHMGAAVQRFDIGGQVHGWSPHPRADNVPAWLTAGEVVQSNAAGDMYGRNRLLALNSRLVDPHAFAAFMHAQGFADGGAVKAKESFGRPAPTTSATSLGGQPATVINRTVNQTNNTYYPVAERESSRVKKVAATDAVGVML